MNAKVLAVLQREQQQHDEFAHRDILALPTDERRITHMALHFAKYSGRLIGMEPLNLRALERIVVDTTIICLVSANILGLRLDDELGAASIDMLIAEQAKRTPFALAALPMWMGTQIAVQNAGIAKACEAFDHHEDYPYHEALRSGVVEILRTCLAVAGAMSLDLSDAIMSRWAGVEEKVHRRAAA